MGAYKKLGVPFGDSHNKDCNILGSILGSPYFGKTTIWCSVGLAEIYIPKLLMQNDRNLHDPVYHNPQI